jgi:hypothetical protein
MQTGHLHQAGNLVKSFQAGLCCRSPSKQMAANAYVLVRAALVVFFEQAHSPFVGACASECLKHILGSMAPGKVTHIHRS